MSYIYTLYGELRNISEENFDMLKDFFESRLYLDTYEHTKDRTLMLNAVFDERKTVIWLHKFMYKKIAACIPEGKYERLYFIEGQFFSCIFFGYNKWEIKEYEEPLCPEWWFSNRPNYLRNLKEKIKKHLNRSK